MKLETNNRIRAASMNQLNWKPPMLTTRAFFACTYCTVEETLSGFSAMLMDLTITVASAAASMFIAVPTSVWSALKLIPAMPRREE